MSKRASTLLSPEKRRAEQKMQAVKDIAERHGDDPAFEIEKIVIKAEDGAGAQQEKPADIPGDSAPKPEPETAPAPAPETAAAAAPAPAQQPGNATETESDAEPGASRSKTPLIVLVLAVALVGGFFGLAPGLIESSKNQVTPHAPYEISAAAIKLHSKLVVGDLHTDSLLWSRDLTKRGGRGHVDLPRLAEGNVALQVFSAVISVPAGQNYEQNSLGMDSITQLAIAQLWPVGSWGSELERALYQSEKLHDTAQRSAGGLRVIRSRSDAEAVLTARANGEKVTGGILLIEGAQALEGDVGNIQRLYDAGYRIIGLQHFFDNELGGSLHGVDKGGLTPFGREAIREMARLGIIIDLAHASEAVVRDVLGTNIKRLIVSHTGINGACDTPRNIPDALMKKIAARGGLIGIGFWDAAVCDISPAGVVKSIRYAVGLVGLDHVALGSDFDGTITTSFDVSELAVLTHEMLKAGFSEIEIRLVMGGNMAGYLLQHLPG